MNHSFRKKGFVISISTILIVITIVWFSVFYQGMIKDREVNINAIYPIEKAGLVADDVIFDISKILGVEQTVGRAGTFMTIGLEDKIPADINKYQLIDYNIFVDGNYGTMQNASISLGLDRLLDGNAEMVFDNGLRYTHQYDGDQNFVRFFRDDGSDTGVFTYDINVYVDGARYDSSGSTAWTCDSGGDVNVNLRYTDNFGESVTSICDQDPTQEYEYEFAFQGSVMGDLVVSFGDVQGNENSVKVRDNIQTPNVSVRISIEAKFAASTEEVVWYYDADLNYVQSDVAINRKIELGSS